MQVYAWKTSIFKGLYFSKINENTGLYKIAWGKIC